ncbi:hypothetical protein Tco_1218485 [Tanacetum coccineum]
MADHSQKWHDGTTSRNIGSSSSNDGLAALVNKLDNLGRDMKKLKECFHAIQVGCQICEGPHLDKDCPLNEEVKQVRYGEFGRTTPFNENNGRRQFLAETIMKYIEESSMRQAKQDEWMQTFCHNLEKSQNHHDEIIQGLKSKETTLAKEAVTKIDKNEDCKAIFTNDGAPLYTPFYYSPAESIHGREVGTLPRFTETNLRGLSYATTTRSGLNYQPPKNSLEDSNILQNITTEHIPTTEKINPEQTHNSTKKTDPPILFSKRLKRRRRKNSSKNSLRTSNNFTSISPL